MCYRTKLNSKIAEIERTFEASFTEPELFSPREEINAFDFAPNPVIADFSQEEILFFNWGLIPSWAKENQIRKNTLNARIETVEEKPAFRDSVKKRCLVLASGFYEWQWLDPAGRKKQKFLIEPQGQQVFAFAGLYAPWKDPLTGALLNTYTILTTEANELMSSIHNTKKRMPVILARQDCAGWLAGKSLENFAYPYEVPLTATSI